MRCRYSSVDTSAPTILSPWVRVPSTPSMLLSFIMFVLYLPCENNKNKQKETWFGPFKKSYNTALDPFCFCSFSTQFFINNNTTTTDFQRIAINQVCKSLDIYFLLGN